MVLGGLLIATGLIQATPYAAFLEWAGSLLAFTGISRLLNAKFALTLASSAFIMGSVGDLLFIKNPSPLNWTLTNYMVFVHALTGTLAGKLTSTNDLKAHTR